MRINVNGESKLLKKISTTSTLLTVIQILDYNPNLVVVEFNGAIVAPKLWEEKLVKDGDTIEIVTIVGGGS